MKGSGLEGVKRQLLRIGGSLYPERPKPNESKVFCCFFRNCPGMEIASTEGKRQRKPFFFEKMTQKTLTHSG
jgi:hypothetical protein